MADLRTLGMYQCTDCGALMAVEQRCTDCNAGAPEDVPKPACAGWGCPQRVGCHHYHTVAMKGSAHFAWFEPPYDHLAGSCAMNGTLADVVGELTKAIRMTIGRQNRN